jgi:hypothetical protein
MLKYLGFYSYSPLVIAHFLNSKVYGMLRALDA